MPGRIRRIIIIVLDGVGAGALPDAGRYGDEGANTLANTAKAVGGLRLPYLQRLGLGNCVPMAGVAPSPRPESCFGIMAESAPAKDTTLGHWELMGVTVDRPFPVFPGGFPGELTASLEKAFGRRVLGNKPASGTEILDDLGPAHLATGRPIVYTSADSVLQIAAHEEIITPEELYRLCGLAREICRGEWGVGRIIARPFAGRPGSFERRPGRRDFSLPPPRPTLLDLADGRGLDVWGVGKVDDIFAGRGVQRCPHVASNRECFANIGSMMNKLSSGILLANLVDFDTLYGHRNDARGMAAALAEADVFLAEIMAKLRPGDLAVITADHGCDPTTPSTDHTREHVPLLAVGPGLRRGVCLGRRTSFADVAATAAELLAIRGELDGTSFAPLLLE